MGNAEAMSEAINKALDNPPSRELLKSRGNSYPIENAVRSYLDILVGEALQKRKLIDINDSDSNELGHRSLVEEFSYHSDRAEEARIAPRLLRISLIIADE